MLRAEEKTEVDRSVPLVCVVNQREELKEELEFLRGEMGKIEEGISQNARVAPVKEMHDEAK